MQTITRRQVVSLSGSAALAALSGPHLGAQAAEWPTQPVRVIVNFAPGGGSDSATRPFMDRLSRLFGQQFFVENRGGASGALGIEAVVKSPADAFLSTPSLSVVIVRSCARCHSIRSKTSCRSPSSSREHFSSPCIPRCPSTRSRSSPPIPNKIPELGHTRRRHVRTFDL
jgi:hypothetical protein